MPTFLEKGSIRYPLICLIGITTIMLGILSFYNWVFSLIGLFLFAIPFYFILRMDSRQKKETEEYITTLSYRVKKVGEEALMEMPIGIMLIMMIIILNGQIPF